MGEHSVRSYVNAVARWNNVTLGPGEADWIIWNRTGYPCFFDGDPAETFRKQVREHFQRLRRDHDACMRCGKETPNPNQGYCFDCAERDVAEYGSMFV